MSAQQCKTLYNVHFECLLVNWMSSSTVVHLIQCSNSKHKWNCGEPKCQYLRTVEQHICFERLTEKVDVRHNFNNAQQGKEYYSIPRPALLEARNAARWLVNDRVRCNALSHRFRTFWFFLPRWNLSLQFTWLLRHCTWSVVTNLTDIENERSFDFTTKISPIAVKIVTSPEAGDTFHHFSHHVSRSHEKWP